MPAVTPSDSLERRPSFFVSSWRRWVPLATRWWLSKRAVLGGMATIAVASTWLVHGFYNKLLGASPRHLMIVQATPGLDGIAGQYALWAIGGAEVALAGWVLTGWVPRLCAATQTLVLLSMNVVELTFASDLLLWPAALIPVNLGFLALAWFAACTGSAATLRVRGRRHPLAVRAHFRECLTLTYAFPADVLRPLLPPGLELDTLRGYGFAAVALVRAESLRPAGWPKTLGQDFFLAGYRVFARLVRPDGRPLRGLRILRSDTNRLGMAVVGNLFTLYNYHRCDAAMDTSDGRQRVTVSTHDGRADLDVSTWAVEPELPADSPFESWKEARRFAGPLPFTFEYEPETHSIIAIEAPRSRWLPTPVNVDVRMMSFFDHPVFGGAAPILAAAFAVSDVDYMWKRGVRFPLTHSPMEEVS